eukprot:3212378-Amphidinium_carterae.1
MESARFKVQVHLARVLGFAKIQAEIKQLGLSTSELPVVAHQVLLKPNCLILNWKHQPVQVKGHEVLQFCKFSPVRPSRKLLLPCLYVELGLGRPQLVFCSNHEASCICSTSCLCQVLEVEHLLHELIHQGEADKYP